MSALIVVPILVGGCINADDGPAGPVVSDDAALPAASAPAPVTDPPKPAATGTTPDPTKVKPDIDPPAIPAKAKLPTKQGLMDAVRFYFDDLSDYMLLTGDTVPFEAICESSVPLCRNNPARARAFHERGSCLQRGAVSLDHVSAKGPLGLTMGQRLVAAVAHGGVFRAAPRTADRS